VNEIELNLKETLERIDRAAYKTGGDPREIKLVAVSKGIDMERIQLGLKAGLTALGENRVQEFLDKYEVLGQKVEWHFVGHLQRNKVKYIIDKVHMIHSLDRLALAEELDKRAKKESVVVNVLVQVNVAGEESKYGLEMGEVVPFIRAVAEKYLNINIRGLMTIAPLANDPETVRPFFRKLRELSVSVAEENIPGVRMDWLSMGMTNDFEVAVEEGANLVRIGRAIFGLRT